MVAGALGCGGADRSTRVEADLAGLRSSDGLYTAPQILALAGNSLGDTAYAAAALNGLGQPVRITARGARKLKSNPEDDAAWSVWYRHLLNRSGAPVPAPTPAQILRVWRKGRGSTPAVEATSRFAVLAQASQAAGVTYRMLPSRSRAMIGRAIAASRNEPAATVQLQRLTLVRFAGQPADARVARALSTRVADGATGEDRAVELSSLVELRAALGRRPDPKLARATAAAVAKAASPAADYAALRAFRRAGQSPEPLRPVGARLSRAVGADGAVRERAVFPGLPKAVWFVAQIRKEAGASALPDAVTTRVSRKVPEVAQRGRSDPDAAGYLLGAAKLAGLEYEGTTLPPPSPPATGIRTAQDAAVWSQRAAVAGVLGKPVPPVRVRSFDLRGESQLGAAGALLATARNLSARVTRSPAWTAEFERRARAQRFQTGRAATQVSAALVTLGDRKLADRIISRNVRLGCGTFKVLASDATGECDLESTLVLLRIRDEVPAAGKLAKRITAEQ